MIPFYFSIVSKLQKNIYTRLLRAINHIDLTRKQSNSLEVDDMLTLNMLLRIQWREESMYYCQNDCRTAFSIESCQTLHKGEKTCGQMFVNLNRQVQSNAYAF